MSHSILTLFFVAFLFNTALGQSIARVENVKIESAILQQERTILVYTPADYDWRKHEFFNVIYVFDSQNREFFDYTTSIISFLTDNIKSYIVVGITSPYNETLDYARNNDLLPELTTKASKKRYGNYSGNASNFLTYVADEVVPYINQNYRTLDNNIAIGHSLSASFVIYAMLHQPNLFKNNIAVSPNLAYNDEALAKALIELDYNQFDNNNYLYISHADEGIDYWQAWKPANEQVYDFFADTLNWQNIQFELAHFQDNNHWNTFPPSLNHALDFYFKKVLPNQTTVFLDSTYEVTIRVEVPNKKDNIFITGNQASLSNWQPDKIKLEKTSDFERSITLQLKSPAQFKFTRGNWSSEAEVEGTYRNICIKPEEQKEYNFKIEGYFDRY